MPACGRWAWVLDDESMMTDATFAIIFFLNASNWIAPTHSFLRASAACRDCVHSSRASEPGQRWQCSRFSTAPTQPAQHSQHSQPTDHFYQRQHQLRRAVFQHTDRIFFAALEATRKFFPRLKWAKTARGVREIGAYGHCMLRYYACMYCTAFRVAHARLLCQP